MARYYVVLSRKVYDILLKAQCERERESLKWHVEDAFNAPLIKCSFYIFSKINQIEPHIYIYKLH